MKRFLVAFGLGVLPVVFSNCTKDETKEEVSNASGITGIWELKWAQSSMTPVTQYPAGNGDLLVFTDSSYLKYTAGQLVKSGRYFITEDSSVEAEVGLIIPQGQFTKSLSFDSISSARKTFIEVSAKSLTLLSGYFPLDGGSKFSYVRQQGNR